jgi:hypothetical protein
MPKTTSVLEKQPFESVRLACSPSPTPVDGSKSPTRRHVSGVVAERPRSLVSIRRSDYGGGLHGERGQVRGGEAKRLAGKLGGFRAGFGTTWDLAPDGKRVAVLTPAETPAAPKQDREVVILLNIFDELRRRAPLNK